MGRQGSEDAFDNLVLQHKLRKLLPRLWVPSPFAVKYNATYIVFLPLGGREAKNGATQNYSNCYKEKALPNNNVIHIVFCLGILDCRVILTH